MLLSATGKLRGAPVTVNSQRTRTASGVCPERSLSSSSISSGGGDALGDRGDSRRLFVPAGSITVTPVKRVNGNMCPDEFFKNLIAVASVGPQVVVFVRVQMTSLPLTRTATWMTWRNPSKRTAGSRFPTVTPSPVTKTQNPFNPPA